VVAAPPDFQVGSVGKRQPDPQKNFVGSEGRDFDLFDAQIFAAVKNGGGHAGRYDPSCQRYDFIYRGFNRLFRGGFHS